MAEVADACWELDQSRSRELFASALEAALSLKAGTKEASQALHQVMTLAAKRDVQLSRKLSEKMLKTAADKVWATAESMSAAIDLLDSDTARAAQLAEAYAPAGPSFPGAVVP